MRTGKLYFSSLLLKAVATDAHRWPRIKILNSALPCFSVLIRG